MWIWAKANGVQSLELSSKLFDHGHALGSDGRLTEQGYGSSLTMPLARLQGVGNDVRFPASQSASGTLRLPAEGRSHITANVRAPRLTSYPSARHISGLSPERNARPCLFRRPCPLYEEQRPRLSISRRCGRLRRRDRWHRRSIPITEARRRRDRWRQSCRPGR
jgi:hypothetical protein